VRLPPPHNLKMSPPIQSTNTTRQNAFRKFLDFTSLCEERMEVGVTGRSGGEGVGGRCDLRDVTCERPFSLAIALLFAVSTGFSKGSPHVDPSPSPFLVLEPGVAGCTVMFGPSSPVDISRTCSSSPSCRLPTTKGVIGDGTVCDPSGQIPSKE
jgi:hypothetical protein